MSLSFLWWYKSIGLAARFKIASEASLPILVTASFKKLRLNQQAKDIETTEAALLTEVFSRFQMNLYEIKRQKLYTPSLKDPELFAASN